MAESASYQLHFPPNLLEAQAMAALLAVAGASPASRSSVTRFELTSVHSKIHHHLSTTPALARQLAGVVPGLTIEPLTPSPAGDRPYVWRLWLSSGRRPLSMDRAESTSRALLSALSGPKASTESVSLIWLLGPVRRPLAVGTRQPGLLSESWPRALTTAAFQAPSEVDADARRGLRSKYAYPGWRAIGLLVATAAGRPRAQQLAAPVLAALRTAEGPSSHFGIRRASPRMILQGTPWRFNLLLSVPELVGLLGWPLGSAGRDLPVEQRRARLLPAPRTGSTTGRLLGRSVIGDQPVQLSVRDAEQHSYVLGPTGTGKSTFLVQQILQDVKRGYGVVALDAKGQLTDQILARYPQSRIDDLVVIDSNSQAPVGINPFAARLEPALIADQLLGIFSKLYSDSWGPRTSDVLGAALLTLARTPGTSLASLPLILTQEGYRRKLVGAIDDPLGVGDFWAWYESLSPELRQAVIAPTMNKVRPFLVRPGLRAMVGQSAPRFDLLDVFTRGRVVLADLAKGSLGPEGSSLLGTTLLSLLWQLTLSRSSVPPERLRPVSLYVDEAQDFLRLPGDIADLLAQARALRVSVTMAHQHLSQISTDLREALLSNARSRMIFQLASSDAARLAQGHTELKADDIAGLPPFESYMSLVSRSAVTPYASVRTLPLEPASNDPGELRRLSAERYGRPRSETEAALRALIAGQGASTSSVGQRPRRPS